MTIFDRSAKDIKIGVGALFFEFVHHGRKKMDGLEQTKEIADLLFVLAMRKNGALPNTVQCDGCILGT